MIHRRFGRTDISMPVLSCCGMRYQHKWDDFPPEEIPKANQENLERTIHHALELGINHIETARGSQFLISVENDLALFGRFRRVGKSGAYGFRGGGN